MAGFIQVPPDSSGKKVDTVTLTDATVEVHRQKIVLTGAGGTAEVAVITNAAPAAGDYGMVVRNVGTIQATLSGTAIVAGAVTLSGTATVAGAVTISGTATVAGIVALSGTATVAGVVGLTAGTAVIGDINAISRTVQVAIATPFTLQGISTTVNVAIATPFTIQGISTTVSVAVTTPFTVNNISATVNVAIMSVYTNLAVPSASHGPKSVIASTSAAVSLIAAPGSGMSIYVTQLAVTNSFSAFSRARVGPSASPSTVQMMVGFQGFIMPLNPPWKLSANEALLCSVKPNASEVMFNVNYFVASADAL